MSELENSKAEILCGSGRPQSFPALTNYPHFPAQCITITITITTQSHHDRQRVLCCNVLYGV